MQKYLVVIPTFNEKENIVKIIGQVLNQSPQLDILVVDDNSPDKTGDLVLVFGQKNKRVNLLTRKRKLGLGTAYRDGFKWGLRKGYNFFISMDADFSHPPKSLPKMIKLSQRNKEEIILGSRYIEGGKIRGWSLYRYLNSYLANFFTRLMLNLEPHDATAGFKCYPAKFLKEIDFRKLTASGYAFQVEMLFWAKKKNFNTIEFPITFIDRRAGESKISGELRKSAKIVFRLFLAQTWVRQLIKFCLVGLACAVLDWAVYFLIKYLTHWDAQNLKQIMKALSFVVSASASFMFNRYWTFRSQEKNVTAQAIKFFLVATLGLGLNNLFFFLITGIFGWPDLAGLMIATALVLLWNFTANKLWVFRVRPGII